jgi:hypothetical protein
MANKLDFKNDKWAKILLFIIKLKRSTDKLDFFKNSTDMVNRLQKFTILTLTFILKLLKLTTKKVQKM